MIAAFILGSYAATVALYAPIALERYWPADRAARLTVLVLQILTCSFLIAAATSGLALALTLIDRLASIDPGVDACADQLPINDESPVGPLIGDLGLVVAAGLAARIVWCLLSTFGTAHLRRREHARALRIVATRDVERDILVLHHDDPACYCLPGRRGTVVVTSGALQRLSPAQLEAVLAHERAHLAGRHHMAVAFAVAVRRAIPGIRLLAYAERETRRLVELIADDAAARQSGASTVAAALAVIGVGRVPGTALGISSRDLPPAVARVARLAGADRELRGRAWALSVVATVAVAMVPILLAAVAVMTVTWHCPRGTDNETPQSAGLSSPLKRQPQFSGNQVGADIVAVTP